MTYLAVSADEQSEMPDTLGHAVGTERFELLARAAGNEACTNYYRRGYANVELLINFISNGYSIFL